MSKKNKGKFAEEAKQMEQKADQNGNAVPENILITETGRRLIDKLNRESQVKTMYLIDKAVVNPASKRHTEKYGVMELIGSGTQRVFAMPFKGNFIVLSAYDNLKGGTSNNAQSEKYKEAIELGGRIIKNGIVIKREGKAPEIIAGTDPKGQPINMGLLALKANQKSA